MIGKNTVWCSLAIAPCCLRHSPFSVPWSSLSNYRRPFTVSVMPSPPPSPFPSLSAFSLSPSPSPSSLHSDRETKKAHLSGRSFDHSTFRFLCILFIMRSSFLDFFIHVENLFCQQSSLNEDGGAMRSVWGVQEVMFGYEVIFDWGSRRVNRVRYVMGSAAGCSGRMTKLKD